MPPPAGEVRQMQRQEEFRGNSSGREVGDDNGGEGLPLVMEYKADNDKAADYERLVVLLICHFWCAIDYGRAAI